MAHKADRPGPTARNQPSSTASYQVWPLFITNTFRRRNRDWGRVGQQQLHYLQFLSRLNLSTRLFSLSTGLERDISDNGRREFTGGWSRINVVYERRRWKEQIIDGKDCKAKARDVPQVISREKMRRNFGFMGYNEWCSAISTWFGRSASNARRLGCSEGRGIRARIEEMAWRCDQLIEFGGMSIESD